jgi:hypothetical protein
LEVPAGETQEYLRIVQDYMEYVPDWATGLPLKAEPVVMDKYGK